MTCDDSEWVNGLFATGASDWTPAWANHAAHILYAPISRDPDASRRCLSVLSDAELQRVDGLVTKDGKDRFKQRRAFRRYCGALALGSRRPLSGIAFAETEKGRPYLPELPNVWFSFSSCRFGFLGAWSSTHRIGIDLEDQTRTLDAVELAQQFFSRAEVETVKMESGLSRLRIFYQLWSLKEAALKSIGEGLPFGLDAFEFELAQSPRVVHAPPEYGGPGRFNAQIIKRTDICAALVIRSADGCNGKIDRLRNKPFLWFRGGVGSGRQTDLADASNRAIRSSRRSRGSRTRLRQSKHELRMRNGFVY
jgi:phosphopantetheinyl transferase